MYYENPHGVSVHSGFPNAAADTSVQPLDINKLLIKNRISTYLMRIAGNQWQEVGIFDGDIAVIDRALAPQANDLVIWVHDDAFAISSRRAVTEGREVWGVVTAIIHQYRERE